MTCLRTCRRCAAKVKPHICPDGLKLRRTHPDVLIDPFWTDLWFLLWFRVCSASGLVPGSVPLPPPCMSCEADHLLFYSTSFSSSSCCCSLYSCIHDITEILPCWILGVLPWQHDAAEVRCHFDVVSVIFWWRFAGCCVCVKCPYFVKRQRGVLFCEMSSRFDLQGHRRISSGRIVAQGVFVSSSQLFAFIWSHRLLPVKCPTHAAFTDCRKPDTLEKLEFKKGHLLQYWHDPFVKLQSCSSTNVRRSADLNSVLRAQDKFADIRRVSSAEDAAAAVYSQTPQKKKVMASRL